MLANRVRKTFRRLHGTFERQSIGAFRLYDRDIPEIRAVVDWYEGHVVVGEYTRQQTAGLPGYLDALAKAAGEAAGATHVHVKRRRTRPREGERYERLEELTGERIPVRERDLRFLCNLDDYLDTGLFNDHRETRALVRAESQGRHVLNLYGYTGSFTCAAAKGGALSTTTVDVSSTYLRWAGDNLKLNALEGPQHALHRGDAREYLRTTRDRFGLCVLDPPSFSDGGFDIQKDHPKLVEAALAVLEPGGVLWFSTNHQRFEPHLPAAAVEMTARTVPADYRNRTAHRSFRIVL